MIRQGRQRLLAKLLLSIWYIIYCIFLIILPLIYSFLIFVLRFAIFFVLSCVIQNETLSLIQEIILFLNSCVSYSSKSSGHHHPAVIALYLWGLLGVSYLLKFYYFSHEPNIKPIIHYSCDDNSRKPNPKFILCIVLSL